MTPIKLIGPKSSQRIVVLNLSFFFPLAYRTTGKINYSIRVEEMARESLDELIDADEINRSSVEVNSTATVPLTSFRTLGIRHDGDELSRSQVFLTFLSRDSSFLRVPSIFSLFFISRSSRFKTFIKNGTNIFYNIQIIVEMKFLFSVRNSRSETVNPQVAS